MYVSEKEDCKQIIIVVLITVEHGPKITRFELLLQHFRKETQ